MRYLTLSLLLLPLLSCEIEDPEPGFDPEITLAPWTEGARYWSFNGEEPRLLLGVERQLPLPPEAQLKNELSGLAKNGGNLYRLQLSEDDDFATEEVKQLVKLTHRKSVILEFLVGTEDHVKVIRAWLNLSKQVTNHVLVTAGERTYYAADATLRVPAFNRAVLAGLPVVTFPEFSPAATNTIRGIRTVERHLKFWDLRPAPELLAGTNRQLATAARDNEGNYAIYLAGAGDVTINLPDDEQVARRVTVIGYLGTQRSETLTPPYEGSFTLTSNEVRGGWMLIERL